MPESESLSPRTGPTPHKRQLPVGEDLARTIKFLEGRGEFGLVRLLSALDDSPDDPLSDVTVRANDLAEAVRERIQDLKSRT